MTATADRDRFVSARVARLATVAEDRTPHLVPVVFTVADDTLVTCVDHKPKSTRRLRRLANIRATPAVSLLVDHYDDDWTALWWVRVDGTAQVIDADAAEAARAIDLLAEKYPQYRTDRPAGPVIVVRDLTWHGWSATP